MDFTFNTNHGTRAFNHTLLPLKLRDIFSNLRELDNTLKLFTEEEVADLEGYLTSVSAENMKVASLSEEPNADGLSASKRRQWEAECIYHTCETAAAGLRAFNFARKNPHLRG